MLQDNQTFLCHFFCLCGFLCIYSLEIIKLADCAFVGAYIFILLDCTQLVAVFKGQEIDSQSLLLGIPLYQGRPLFSLPIRTCYLKATFLTIFSVILWLQLAIYMILELEGT